MAFIDSLLPGTSVQTVIMGLVMQIHNLVG